MLNIPQLRINHLLLLPPLVQTQPFQLIIPIRTDRLLCTLVSSEYLVTGRAIDRIQADCE